MTLRRHARTIHVDENDRHRLLSRFPGADLAPDTDSVSWPEHGVRVVDSGENGMTFVPDHDVTIHMLGQADEATAHLMVDEQRIAIAPGDTTSVPAGCSTSISANQLAVIIESRGAFLQDVIAPHHGVETFDGFNRCTTYRTPPDVRVERWKITDQRPLPPADSPAFLLGIYGALTLTKDIAIDVLTPMRALESPANVSVNLRPDGLTYVLRIVRLVSEPSAV